MGRLNILGYGYREWAVDIFQSLNMYGYNIQIERSNDRVEQNFIKEVNPDLILFYGWSWKVPDWLIEKYVALCLHPSPLPKYRGGSPIQNQILSGEKEGAVSIFRMDKDVDTGPLCVQVKFSLEGSMGDILKRIRDIGVEGTRKIIDHQMNGGVKYWPQQGMATVYQRRTPAQSEITIDELASNSADYLYNKIRSLQDPYPNAFITCADGSKLYLTEAHVG